MFSRNAALVGVLLVILMTAQPGWAQEARGTILGRVTDSSGAVIPGASVTISNVATGVSVTVQTNPEGNYSVPFLIPGTYRITVDSTGFKRFVRRGLELRVNDQLEVNISLEVGEITQSIEVTGETPLLETASASVGQVVDSRRIAELPIAHGNPYMLMRIASSIAFAGNPNQFGFDQPWEPRGNTIYAMAGSRTGRAEFTLDGASNTMTDQVSTSDVTPAFTPPADAVAEFKVQTAVFDATMGQTEGGVVNVSLKSGTNAFHGTGYYAMQDPSMNANMFFANRAGQPRGDFDYKRWGGTFNGPVILPKVYNGRNQTFFMFAYEGIHQTTPRGSVMTVPTADQRNGDFSDLLKLGSKYQIYDPFSRRPASGGRFINQPVPGNIIPSSQISPIATNILSYYPLPTEKGTADGANNLPRPTWPGRIRYHSHLYRFDHNLSEKNRLFFRFNFYRRDSIDCDWFGFDNPALGAIFWQESSGFALDDVHVFSPTFVMNLRVSDSRFIRAQDTTMPGRNFDLTTLGLPASLRDAIDPSFRRFPYIRISGYQDLGARTPLRKPTETRSLAATFHKIVGGHDLSFGGEFRAYVENQVAGNAQTGGLLKFDPTYTRGPFDNSPAAPRGQGLASLLYGVPSWGAVYKPANYAQLSTVWAGFVQDQWKVTRRLNLTVGLRYELEGPLTERYNRSVRGFDYNAQLPIEAQAKANYAENPTPEIPVSEFSVRGGLTFAGVGGQPRTLWDRDANNFMPRLGFAYKLSKKTVLRGGYGVYFGSLGARRTDVIQTGFSRQTPLVASYDGGLTFAATLANPFPNGILLPRGAADGPMTNVGNSVSFFNTKPHAPRSQKWIFSIQRELPGHFMVDATYQGSRGTDLEVQRQLSALPNPYLSTSPTRDQATIDYLSAKLPSPFKSLLPGTGRASKVIARGALLRPYPQFTSVGTSTNEGDSWYNSLNLRVERRFSRGFSFQAAYTWSKFIEATSLLNGADPTPARVISDQDFPHHLALSWLYELPLGRGRKFLSHIHSVPAAIVGGWQVSGIFTAQSGRPLGFGDAILYGTLHDVPLPEGQRTPDRWFNTDVFERDPRKQLSYHLRTMSLRFNGIRSDGLNYWDMAVMKDTKLTERVKLEFRAEFFNIFNHVTFFTPNSSPVSSAFGTINKQLNLPRRGQLTLRLKF